MDIRHLQTLRAVVDAGSFTGAAESLYVTQSAVSVQIRQLEDAVGVTLFTRMSTGVRATHAGEVLYRYAGRILAVANEAQRELGALEEGRGQPVRIATNDVCAFLVSAALASFAPRHPDTDISVFEGAVDVVISRVERGDADLAVVATVGGKLDEERRPSTLLPLDLVALAPPGHPAVETGERLDIAALALYPLALYQPGSLIRNIVDGACADASVRPRIVLESNWLGSLVRAVESGIALSIVPRLAVAAELQQGRVVAVGVPQLDDCMAIEVISSVEPLRPTVKALLDDVIGQATEMLSRVEGPTRAS